VVAMNLEFKVAETIEELNGYFHLRWKIYKEIGWIDPDEYPDQIEKDEFDEISTHVICKDLSDGKIIAGLRLVPDSPLGFPLERYFSIKHLGFDRSKVMELSRRVTLEYTIPNKYKTGLASLGVLAKTYKYFIENKIDYYINASQKEQLRAISKMRGITEPISFKYESLRGKNGLGLEVFFSYGEISKIPLSLIRKFKKV
jgi:hypothetical protein